jgi:hypothetical protein
MPASDRRLVIAFFNGDEQSIKDAAGTMRRFFPREKIEVDLAGAPASPQRSLSQLRMPDEGLLSAWLPVSELGAAIQTLQSARAQAIFLTGGGLPPPETETRLKNVRDWQGLLKVLREMAFSEASARDYLVQSVGLGHPASPAMGNGQCVPCPARHQRY